MALDLHEIGPDGERWYAIDFHDNGIRVNGHCNPIRFCQLSDMIEWTHVLNDINPPTSMPRYRAFLASSRPLHEPYVWHRGRSKQTGEP